MTKEGNWTVRSGLSHIIHSSESNDSPSRVSACGNANACADDDFPTAMPCHCYLLCICGIIPPPSTTTVGISITGTEWNGCGTLLMKMNEHLHVAHLQQRVYRSSWVEVGASL